MSVNIYSRDREATMQSDFISLHCPATPENTGFVNSQFLSKLKDGAILINTARGALINEADLAAALRSGKLAAAAVDVVGSEPMKEDCPLLGVPNLLITPHIAWSTQNARATICRVCADNLKSWRSGGDLNRLV
jgi:glycerate dehydrogenase